MKVREVMTPHVIRIGPGETAAVAARTLTHYNIGVLPVCQADGKLCGVLTDRDIVTRCLAASHSPEQTMVGEIMTKHVVSARPDMDAAAAAAVMAREQVRRLPVMEDGMLCGMVTLGDLCQNESSAWDAADALTEITSNIAHR